MRVLVRAKRSRTPSPASERIFSETGRILEARRQLMIPELLNSLVFYVILDESFLRLFIYEIKFEIGTM